ncbi:MAG: DUF302 domain-containing protein [Xanthobacteraceae bacterium]|nr:DUF302 domain-containing protein [Xanthobacteraceae bacterium]
MDPAGVVTKPSGAGPAETLERLDAAIRARGMTVFARIDHAAGAREAGLSLRPTTVVIFGNAVAGTPLMQAAQTIGIDLPLRGLVWQDAAGATFVSFNDPAWLAARHGLDPAAKPQVAAMTAALHAVTDAAVAAA